MHVGPCGESAMGGFNLKMEDYPELKASENMMQLSEEITTTENRIASARQGSYKTQMILLFLLARSWCSLKSMFV
jgi:hypothetical protein